jgi:hypothetical protein
MKLEMMVFEEGTRCAKLVVDDVGILSVQCFENNKFAHEISTTNKTKYNSLEEYAKDWVKS